MDARKIKEFIMPLTKVNENQFNHETLHSLRRLSSPVKMAPCVSPAMPTDTFEPRILQRLAALEDKKSLGHDATSEYDVDGEEC